MSASAWPSRSRSASCWSSRSSRSYWLLALPAGLLIGYYANQRSDRAAPGRGRGSWPTRCSPGSSRALTARGAPARGEGAVLLRRQRLSDFNRDRPRRPASWRPAAVRQGGAGLRVCQRRSPRRNGARRSRAPAVTDAASFTSFYWAQQASTALTLIVLTEARRADRRSWLHAATSVDDGLLVGGRAPEFAASGSAKRLRRCWASGSRGQNISSSPFSPGPLVVAGAAFAVVFVAGWLRGRLRRASRLGFGGRRRGRRRLRRQPRLSFCSDSAARPCLCLGALRLVGLARPRCDLAAFGPGLCSWPFGDPGRVAVRRAPPVAALNLSVRRDLWRAAALVVDRAGLGGPIERGGRRQVSGDRGGLDGRRCAGGSWRRAPWRLYAASCGRGSARLADARGAARLSDALETRRRACAPAVRRCEVPRWRA